MLAPYS